MPIKKKWQPLSKSQVEQETNDIGYYELGDENQETVFIGEGEIRDKLLSHLPKGDNPMKAARYYRYITTGNKKEAQQQENILLKEFIVEQGQIPYYNDQQIG